MLCGSRSPSLQGQTVGLLTQRLADARSAIAAELQDAATERARSKVRRTARNHKMFSIFFLFCEGTEGMCIYDSTVHRELA